MKCSAVQYIRIRAAFDWSICHTTREQWQKLRSAQRGSRGCNEDTDMKYTRALPREASPRASAVSSCPAANCLCRSCSGPRLLGSRANGPHMMMRHWPVTHIHIGQSGGKQGLRASPIAREAEQNTQARPRTCTVHPLTQRFYLKQFGACYPNLEFILSCSYCPAPSGFYSDLSGFRPNAY